MAEYVTPAEFEKNEQMKIMFIGNIPKDATDEEVQEYFSTFGECTVEVHRNPPKIFGFAKFPNCDMVDETLKHRPFKIKDREVLCKRAVSKKDSSETAHLRTKQIFFANASNNLTEDKIRTYLEKRHPSQFGKITEINLVKNKDGDEKHPHKGYGFITCDCEDLVDRITMGDRQVAMDPTQPTKMQEFKKAWMKGEEGGRGGHGGRGGRGGPRGGFRGRGGGPRGGRGGGYPQAGGHGGHTGAHGGGYGSGYAGYGGGYDSWDTSAASYYGGGGYGGGGYGGGGYGY